MRCKACDNTCMDEFCEKCSQSIYLYNCDLGGGGTLPPEGFEDEYLADWDDGISSYTIEGD